MGIIFGAIVGLLTAISFFGVFADPIFQILTTDSSQLAAHLYLNGTGALLGWIAWIAVLFCSGIALIDCFLHFFGTDAEEVGMTVGGIVVRIFGGIVGGIVGGTVGWIVGETIGGIVGEIVRWIVGVIVGGWIVGETDGAIDGAIVDEIDYRIDLSAAAISSVVVCLLSVGAIHAVRNPPLSRIEIAEQNVRNLEVTNTAVMRLVTATAEQVARDMQATSAANAALTQTSIAQATLDAYSTLEMRARITRTALWLQARSPDAPTATGVASPGTPTIAPTPTETPTVTVTPSVTPTSALVASQTAVVHQRETLQARLTQLAPDDGTGSSNSSAGSDLLTLLLNILRDPVFQGLGFIVAVIAAIIAYLDYRSRRKYS
jgi:hypothetical protein